MTLCTLGLLHMKALNNGGGWLSPLIVKEPLLKSLLVLEWTEKSALGVGSVRADCCVYVGKRVGWLCRRMKRRENVVSTCLDVSGRWMSVCLSVCV